MMPMSYKDDCLFCRIMRKFVPSDKVYEDSFCYAFRDVNPQAPTHILMVPRAHLASVAEVDRENGELIGHVFAAIAKVARNEGLERDGYRVVTNCGEGAGQTIDHLHFHILSGGNLSEKMN